jgi:hypothetical protein
MEMIKGFRPATIFTCIIGILAATAPLDQGSQALAIAEISPSVSKYCLPDSEKPSSAFQGLMLAEVQADEEGFQAWLPISPPSQQLHSAWRLPQLGDSVMVMRCVNKNITQIVGNGKVKAADAHNLILSVQAPSPNLTKPFRLINQYPRPMVGDFIIPLDASLETVRSVFPFKTYFLSDVFETSDVTETTPGLTEPFLRLTDFGKKQFKDFFDQNEPKHDSFLIQVHYFENNNPKESTLKSQLRANTIKTYLVSELGIRPEKIIAMGLGDSEWNAGFSNYIPKFNKTNASFMSISVPGN